MDRSGLSAGDYSESISISSNGGSATVTVTMTVEGPVVGDIQGVIYDATNTQPLSGATITTEPTTSSKITDKNGSFLIEGIEPGDYTLQVTKTGYQSNTTTVKVIAGETSSADL